MDAPRDIALLGLGFVLFAVGGLGLGVGGCASGGEASAPPARPEPAANVEQGAGERSERAAPGRTPVDPARDEDARGGGQAGVWYRTLATRIGVPLRGPAILPDHVVRAYTRVYERELDRSMQQAAEVKRKRTRGGRATDLDVEVEAACRTWALLCQAYVDALERGVFWCFRRGHVPPAVHRLTEDPDVTLHYLMKPLEHDGRKYQIAVPLRRSGVPRMVSEIRRERDRELARRAVDRFNALPLARRQAFVRRVLTRERGSGATKHRGFVDARGMAGPVGEFPAGVLLDPVTCRALTQEDSRKERKEERDER